MENERDVFIHIKSIQTDSEGARNEIEFYAEGKYIEKGGSKYLTYAESEISGMEGTKTTMKITGNTLSILRFGSISSKFVFEKDTKTTTRYQTEFGTFELLVNTKELDMELRENERSSIYLKYLLDIVGQGEQENELNISF